MEEDLKNDPSIIGYTKYSQFRVGNIVRIPIGYKGFGDSIIGEILTENEDNNPDLFLIKSLETGGTAKLLVGIDNGFSAANINPQALGYKRDSVMDKVWSNGVTLLRHITNIEDSTPADLNESHFSEGTPYRTSHIGYEVETADEEELLYRARAVEWKEDHAIVTTGLQYVHELQNLYSDLLPDKKLDLDEYIQLAVKLQQERRKSLDQYAAERDKKQKQ